MIKRIVTEQCTILITWLVVRRVASSCEQGIERSGSIEGGEFN
jgi:hypothetical protein